VFSWVVDFRVVLFRQYITRRLGEGSFHAGKLLCRLPQYLFLDNALHLVHGVAGAVAVVLAGVAVVVGVAKILR
jgi:hypothetical protein